MNQRDRALCVIYGALTMVDLLIMTVIGVIFVLDNFHDGFAGLIVDFVRDALSNSAGWFVYGDLTITWIALSVFMVFEARRRSIRFVWAYIAAAPLTALCVSFPAFMLARQLRLAATRKATLERGTHEQV